MTENSSIKIINQQTKQQQGLESYHASRKYYHHNEYTLSLLLLNCNKATGKEITSERME